MDEKKEYPTDMKLSFELKDGKVLWSYRVGTENCQGEDAIGLDDMVCFVRILERFDIRWKEKSKKRDREWLLEGAKRELKKESSDAP